MIMALLWLTVSTPFVFRVQQEQKKEIQKQSKQTDNNNPFSNTTEEKNETGVNTLSEYLHDHPSPEKNFILVTRLYKRYPSSIYCEHHPELLSPPPEA
jgi:TFIIF-interacting CTD phosphatase-like protein